MLRNFMVKFRMIVVSLLILLLSTINKVATNVKQSIVLVKLHGKMKQLSGLKSAQ